MRQRLSTSHFGGDQDVHQMDNIRGISFRFWPLLDVTVIGVQLALNGGTREARCYTMLAKAMH